MNITYWPVLSTAWRRSRALLFGPVRLERWFGLGFTAWLAYIWNTFGLGGSHGDSRVKVGPRVSLEALGSVLSTVSHRFVETMMAMWVAMFALAVVLVMAWIASRGAFMYLDNVAHARSRVTEPWRRFAHLGDSLFLWRLLYLFAPLLVGAVLVVPAVVVIGSAHALNEGLGVLAIVVLGLTGVLLAVAALLLSFWTDQFVVPLMYRYDEGVLDAWRRFLPLVRQRLGSFVLYSLFYLLLSVVAWTTVVVAGLLTCCIGLALVSIPYLGTVLLLPFWVTERGLGPDFLAQFGPEWDIWPETIGDGTGDAGADGGSGRDDRAGPADAPSELPPRAPDIDPDQGP